MGFFVLIKLGGGGALVDWKNGLIGG